MTKIVFICNKRFIKRKFCSKSCASRSRGCLSTFEVKNNILYIKTKRNTILADAENIFLTKVNWYIDNLGYAMCRPLEANFGIYKSKRMHVILLGRKPGLEIDHINRNKLDNRLSNLRFVTHRENILNSNRCDSML